MRYNFPEIKTTRTIPERVKKIEDEIAEFREESMFSDEEAVDILHATETFIRGQFIGREEELDRLIAAVKEKNTARGYYTQSCF